MDQKGSLSPLKLEDILRAKFEEEDSLRRAEEQISRRPTPGWRFTVDLGSRF